VTRGMVNHIIFKCDLERDCIHYFVEGVMTWPQDATYQDLQSSVGLQWWRAWVQALATSVATLGCFCLVGGFFFF